jgi:hypothetical protein
MEHKNDEEILDGNREGKREKDSVWLKLICDQNKCLKFERSLNEVSKDKNGPKLFKSERFKALNPESPQ